MDINPSWFLVIATMARYKEALDSLMSTLRNVAWPENQIILVYGNDPSGNITHQDDYKDAIRSCLDVNLYEYNAFIGIQRLTAAGHILPEGAAYMLLHDTCEVGPTFVEKASIVFTRYENEIWNNPHSVQDPHLMWLSAVGQANLCIFNRGAANGVTDHFDGFKNLEKLHAIRIELNMDDMSLKRLPFARSHVPDHPVAYQPIPKYSSGAKRNIMHFLNLDVYKYYFYCNHPGGHVEVP